MKKFEEKNLKIELEYFFEISHNYLEEKLKITIR